MAERVRGLAEAVGLDGVAVVAGIARMFDIGAHIERLSGWFAQARDAVSGFFAWLGTVFQREVLTEQERAAFEQAGYDVTLRLVAGLTSGDAALYDAGAALTQSLWDGAVARFWQFIEWVRSILAQIVAAIGSIDLSNAIRWPSMPSWMRGSVDDPARRAEMDRIAQGEAAGTDGSRAIGGSVRAGFGYTVNEEGLEVFVPDRPGRILRHQEVTRLMAGAVRQPAQTLTIGDIHVHAAPGMDARAVAAEVRRQIEDALRAARFALNDGGLHA